MQNRHKLSIEGMHCGACVRRVTTALQSVAGVKIDSVEIGSASITFDPSQSSAEKVTSALEHIGFPAVIAG